MRSNRKKKRIWPRVVGIILLLCLAGGGVYAFSVYHSLKDAIAAMNQPIGRTKSDLRDVPVSLKNKEPFSVLIMGVDERPGDSGRSDTMIVLTVNPALNSVKMLSIPRDTRTEIVGKGTKDKINHAYAFGGIPMAIDTVENFLGIPIDYYVKINMEGFKDIVDAIGGVTVHNDFDFRYNGHHFAKGDIDLDGARAINFSRMRHQDPQGDFGREARQRKIIEAIINKGASLSSLGRYSDIFAALGKNVKTNLTFDEMVAIQENYKDASSHIEQMKIKGTNTRIDNIFYVLVSPEERQSIQDELKTHLGLN